MNMTEYIREYPLFSLCGLNCGLCPRYQTDGKSKCPGCGGKDFHLKHPSCAVITCNRKHDNVEYCFHCSEYPCKKYAEQGNQDSFITYKNVESDFNKAKKKGLTRYKSELDKKVVILEYLINNFNDGKKKNFYCIAVNLLSLGDLKKIMKKIKIDISRMNIEDKNKIIMVTELLESAAAEKNIELKLRK